MTLVEGDPKASFSIAALPRCRGERYPFPGIAPLYPYTTMLSVKQGGIKYHFLSLWNDSTWDWNPVSQTLLDLDRESKKTVEHESDNYSNYIWCSWYSHQRIGTRTGGQINKIRISVEDRQSRIAWHIVNKFRGRKGTSRTKLKAASQEERFQKWKEHFKNLLGNTQKSMIKLIKKLLMANKTLI